MAEIVLDPGSIETPRNLPLQNNVNQKNGISLPSSRGRSAKSKTHHSSSNGHTENGVVGGSSFNITTQHASLVDPTEDELDERCGWLCFRPGFLQGSRTAKSVLFWLCWAGAVQGMVVNGFVNVCITTIEKRYNLRSTDTGLIAGAYDIASVLCAIPVSYLGSRPGASKPRWLGWGIFIMGIGSFVFTLPHFISPPYYESISNTADSPLDFSSVMTCLRQNSRSSHCKESSDAWLSNFRHVFILGQFLHGVGASPLYTLGITFLDESVPVKMSSLYLGIFYAMAIIGPACGYVLGGQFLKTYIDAPTVDPATLDLLSTSDRWLGGWWIGFLVSGTIAVLVSLPVMAFPPKLPGSKEIAAQRVSEAYESNPGGDTSTSNPGFGRLKDLPRASVVLALNPTFVALSLAGATEGILLTGFATFMPKFLESQFSVQASSAALIVGFVAVPAGGGGTLLGGWILKKLQLRCAGILKLCILFSSLCFLSCFTFIISCPNVSFAGVSVDYTNTNIVPIESNLTSSCNADCGCKDMPYDPVCGANNVLYFSPCHAGCSTYDNLEGKKVYKNCSCVLEMMNVNESNMKWSASNLTQDPGTALQDKCPSKCGLIQIFLVIFFVVMLITFILSLPALTGTLRCVPDSHKSFALGLQWIVVRLLGTIPGPILFGALIDDTCRLWQDTCGLDGACRNYDNYYMSRYMMGISLISKFLSTVLFIIAWWLYVPPKSLPESSTNGPTPSTTTSSLQLTPAKEFQAFDNPALET